MAKRAQLLPRVLFLHIGWAREYRGAPDDLPVGTFGYIKDGGENVGEALNFKSYRGKCYGYAPRTAVNIKRLMAAPGAEYVEGILVVWTATDPAQGGRYIVGWYQNARVFAKLTNNRPDKIRPEMLVEAAKDDCHLVAVDERTFFLPSRIKGWPGIASTFFASEAFSPENLKKVLDYIAGAPSSGFSEDESTTVPPNGPKGWPTQDPELRAEVEKAAIDAVVIYYKQLGWRMASVEDENFGWDLEARKSGRLLRIEVKGRGGVGAVEITPNEYTAMLGRETRMSYRLIIVHGCLTRTPKLAIFEYAPVSDTWVGPNGLQLLLEPRTGARASFN